MNVISCLKMINDPYIYFYLPKYWWLNLKHILSVGSKLSLHISLSFYSALRTRVAVIAAVSVPFNIHVPLIVSSCLQCRVSVGFGLEILYCSRPRVGYGWKVAGPGRFCAVGTRQRDVRLQVDSSLEWLKQQPIESPRLSRGSCLDRPARDFIGFGRAVISKCV